MNRNNAGETEPELCLYVLKTRTSTFDTIVSTIEIDTNQKHERVDSEQHENGVKQF